MDIMNGTAPSTGDYQRFERCITAIKERVLATLAEGEMGFPHYAQEADGGRWTRTPDGDWTGGFWVGQMWLLAYTTNDAGLRSEAHKWALRLSNRTDSDTIFRGFLFWYGIALGYLLGEAPDLAAIAERGADALDRSFNAAAGLMPLGDEAEEASRVGHGATNVDGVPGGTPLLAWAARRTGREELAEHARSHAWQHINFCVREDGSVCQSATFERSTGDLLVRYTHKGICDGSTWARAQTWAMLGLAQAAVCTDREAFLPEATRVADWYVAHLPADYICRWDFDDPAGLDAVVDTSATAIGTAALLKVAELGAARSTEYRRVALRSLNALVAHHLVVEHADNQLPVGMLRHGCYDRRIGLAENAELVWGTYFLLESLLHITGQLHTAGL